MLTFLSVFFFSENQRDYFSNDTFRGRSLVSSAVYYEVTLPDIFPLRPIFGGVTEGGGKVSCGKKSKLKKMKEKYVDQDEEERKIQMNLLALDHVIHVNLVLMKMNNTAKRVITVGSPNFDGTYTCSGYSYHMVCEEHFVLRWPDNFSLDSGAPLLCAGITSYTSLKKFGLGIPDMKVGMVVLVGLVMLLPRWLDLVLNS
ncbi:mannitol dehydrogenase-like protein [Tanacetum coccineum]